MKYTSKLRLIARWFPTKFLNPDKKTIKDIKLKLDEIGYSDVNTATKIFQTGYISTTMSLT